MDLDVDAAGIVRATDTGRHQVTAWALDGTPTARFGKFGMSDPADFVGCCNPVNLATTPDGKVVTAEKMVARVKVYEPDGRLLAVIGPEHFDPKCTQIYLAVDSKGRLLAADPVRREIKVFAQVVKIGVNEPSAAKQPAPAWAGMSRATTGRSHSRATRGRGAIHHYPVEGTWSDRSRGAGGRNVAKVWTALRACRAAASIRTGTTWRSPTGSRSSGACSSRAPRVLSTR